MAKTALGDIVVNVLDDLWKKVSKAVTSEKGATIIISALSGMGAGAVLSKPEGRKAVAQIGTILKDAFKDIHNLEYSKMVRKAIKAAAVKVATKLATGATAVVGAVFAGAAVGTTVGDYVVQSQDKGVKGFMTEFGKDLAANLIAGPAGSVVRHLWNNRQTIWNGLTGKSSTSKSTNESTKQEEKSQQVSVSKSTTSSVPSKSDYDEAAKQLGMVSRPGHPTAEYYWQKEVEKQMKTNKPKATKPAGYNSPDWYLRGLATKLMATTLTWTSIKKYESIYAFVPAVAMRVGLVIPTENYKIHPQIKSNINILWQALRGKNTGAFNYTEQDVYVYQFALASMIARHRFLCKIVNLINCYDPEVTDLNGSLLTAVFGSLGQTRKSEIIINKPSFCEQLNTIAKDLNTYALHGDTLISRWNYIADKCIKDYDGPKYVRGIYKIETYPTLDPNAGGTDLVYRSYVWPTDTVQTMISNLKAELDLFRSFNGGVLLKVAGDMIKLLGANTNTFANTIYINGSEVPEFIFDAEANDQLRNAKIMNYDTDPNSSLYMQAPTYAGANHRLTCQYHLTTNITAPYYEMAVNKQDWIITSDRNKEFSFGENLQLVQFCCDTEISSQSAVRTLTCSIKDCSPTVLMGMTIATYNSSNVPVHREIQNAMSFDSSVMTINGQSINVGTGEYNLLAQIDFFPSPEIVNQVDASTIAFKGRWLDVDNYAYMTDKQFQQLNNVSVYSMTYHFNPEDVKIIGLVE